MNQSKLNSRLFVPSMATLIIGLLFSIGVNSTKERTAMKHLTVSSGFGSIPFNPKARLSERTTFYSAVLGNLLTLEDSHILKPSLLKEWYWDFDTGEYVLVLPADLKFHDGSRVTSHAVAFGIVRWAYADPGGIIAHNLREIEGIDNITKEQALNPELIAGISIPNEIELRIKVRSNRFGLMYRLTFPDYSPTKPDFLEDDLLTWKSAPVGAGSFKVTSHDIENKSIELIRFSERGKGTLSNITFVYDEENWLDSDIIVWPFDAQPAKSGTHKLVKLGNNVDLSYILELNYNQPFVKNQAFRKALDLLIDREVLANQFEDTIPLHYELPPEFWGIENRYQTRDIARAKDLIEKVREQLPNRPLKIRVRNGVLDPIPLGTMDILRSNLNEVGLEVEFITEIDNPAEVWSEKNHDIRFMWMGVGASFDPLSHYGLYLPDSPYSDMIVPDSAELIDYRDNAIAAKSFEVRVEETRKLANFFKEQAFSIPLYGKLSSIWLKEVSATELGKQRSAIMIYLDRIKVHVK